jgi:peptide/nickel transport system ATP-binding protein
MNSVLEVFHLSKAFPVRGGLIKQLLQRGGADAVRAVDDISFSVAKGEVVGIVGESGSGKSTTGLAILRLTEPSGGQILFLGNPVPAGGRDLLRFRRQAQMIFQDPYQSLNPRFTIFDIVAEPLIIHGLASGGVLAAKVLATLDQAGLRPPADFLRRYPHELSGGQRQRVAIARALVLEPRLIVADEPVSMLDVSVRAGILRLLRSLSRDFGMSIVYISHDISTVRYLCDRTAVMYSGRIVEIGPTAAILDTPKHPYTAALLAAVPRIQDGPQRPRVTIPDEVAASVGRPSGCVFHRRCPRAFTPCEHVPPPPVADEGAREVACHLYQASENQPAEQRLSNRREWNIR